MVHRLPRARAVERDEFLLGAATGRTVTHVGFADAGMRATARDDGRWLHARLATVAASLVGVDVEEDGVREACAAGYDAHLVDCRDPAAVAEAGIRPAELLIVGDVIEHVDAVGPFLDGLRALVEPHGTMIMTTPNACRLLNACAALGRREFVHPDHVAWYSWYTLRNVLERHAWWVVGFRSYQADRAGVGGLAGLLVSAERAAARRIAPFLGAGLVAICHPARLPATT